MNPIARLSGDWPAINALLDEALELPAAQQAAWLDALRGDDATHRHVLRDLLRHRANVESVDFLGFLPQFDAGDGSKAPSSVATGGLVGPYRLLSEIAHGGMGTVWLAERADGSMQRKVALKLPRAAWGVDFAERLSRESRILESLEHRNIARLYDAGLDALRRPFLAMEYVEGQPIDLYCRERALSVRQRIALVLQVAAAVAHAHAKLVVHRDLKPSNILVTHDGEVKLLDFGIAKLLSGDVTQPSALTEVAGAALTLDYASPEQIDGLPLGTASDVYSLGVVVFELLANARPYRLKRHSAAEIEEAIASVDPRRASDVATDPASRKQLKGDLDAILDKALRKSVDARYQSVEAFARDLERFLGGLPVEARPDSRRYRVGKYVRRHRLALGMGAALTAAIVAGAGVSLWQAREARQQAARAESEVDAQLAVRDLYRETMTALDLTVTADPAALARPGAIVAALKEKLVEMEPRYTGRPNGRDAQLEAVSTQLNYNNDFEGSLAVGRRYLASLKEHRAPADRVLRAYTLIAKDLFRLKRFDACEAVRREAVAWAPDVVDPVTVAARSFAYSDLGSLLISFGKRAEAERLLLEGDALMDRTFETGEFTFVPLQLSQLYTGFDEARALQYARKGHRGALLRPEADADQRGFDLLTLGTALAASGRSAEAGSVLHDAHELLLQLYPPGDNGVLRVFNRWVGAVGRQGDPARAASMLAEKRRTLAAMPGGLTPYAAMYLDAREADIAWLAGDVARAAIPTPALDALVAAAVRTDHDSPLLAHAQLLVLAGRPDEALSLLDRIGKQWPTPGAPTAMWVRLQQVVAVAQSYDGRADDSRTTARALQTLLEQQHATTGNAYRTALELEALAAVRLGDPADAKRTLALLDGIDPAPPFASPVERAESSLRRAEVFVATGRVEDGRAAGRAALTDLKAQHPDSPRLVAARRYANVAAAADRDAASLADSRRACTRSSSTPRSGSPPQPDDQCTTISVNGQT